MCVIAVKRGVWGASAVVVVASKEQLGCLRGLSLNLCVLVLFVKPNKSRKEKPSDSREHVIE